MWLGQTSPARDSALVVQVLLPSLDVKGTHPKDVVSSVAAAGVEKYALIGQSMDGDVAVRVTAEQSDAMTALVLIGSSARAEPPEQLAAFTGVVDQMETSGFDAGMQQMVLEIMLGARMPTTCWGRSWRQPWS